MGDVQVVKGILSGPLLSSACRKVDEGPDVFGQQQLGVFMTTSNWPNRAGDRSAEGCVLYVKDTAWGFEAVGRSDHPGIVLWLSEDERYCTLLKGTDAEHVRDRWGTYIIEPDELNGLVKPTAFRLEPRVMTRRLIMLMLESPRWVGRVDDQHLDEMRRRVARAFGGTVWRR
jgi:hypothetical protein